MAIAEQEEIIYYELVKMEKRITEKADLILKAEKSIDEKLAKFEILFSRLLQKIEGWSPPFKKGYLKVTLNSFKTPI